MGVDFVAMSNSPTKGSYSVDDLLAKAEELLQSSNTVPLAQKFYARALEMEPNNTQIMDDYAECLLELQEIEQAGQLISKSIELDPEGGYQKYMIAGQLTSGMDSLSCFNKGIEILLRMHEEAKNQPDVEEVQSELAHHLCLAYCSMAEIFMTDCCFEEGAEEECTRLIEEAIKWKHSNAEAHLLRARCSLAKSDPDSALPSILTSYNIWKDKEENEWPQYSVRVNTAKILIEVRQLEDATDLLEKLTHEDDEDSEVWYLLALCYYNLAEDSEDPETLVDAEESIKTSLKLLQQDENQMQEAVDKAQSLLHAVQEAMNKDTMKE